MAQESCNLDKDEAELLKPSSSASTTSAAPPPPASAPSPTIYLKTTTTTSSSQDQHHQLQPQQQVGPRTDAPKNPAADSHATNSSFTRKRKLEEASPPPEPDASLHVITKAQKTESTLDAPGAAARAVNRCSCCQKRVGLTGFRCRCGDLFCAAHRYSDAHGCSYDYKAAGRAEISKANPVIRAPKIIKI